MRDMSESFVVDFPVRKTETVQVKAVKVGDWIITENSAGVPFYRLIHKIDPYGENGVALEFDRDRWIGGPDSDKPGFCGRYDTVPNGGDGYVWPDASRTVQRVTDMDGFHVLWAGRLARGSYGGRLDRLTDGRIVWEVAQHVHSSGDLLIRFAHEDDYVRVPLGATALVRKSHRDE